MCIGNVFGGAFMKLWHGILISTTLCGEYKMISRSFLCTALAGP